VDARCLLVHVDNKWLVAIVPPTFEGNELTGYVVPFDATTSRPMLEQIMRAEPKLNAILPFEFNGIEGSASDQGVRHMGAGVLGFVGLVGVLLGVYLIPFGARRAAMVDARIDRTMQPVADNAPPQR
jgi:hypothetical protein